MPILSQFYGIIIKMYFQQSEHNPPHIHATYGDYAAEFNIRTSQIMEGVMPPKEIALIKVWLKAHRNELLEIWDTQHFKKITPLVNKEDTCSIK